MEFLGVCTARLVNNQSSAYSVIKWEKCEMESMAASSMSSKLHKQVNDPLSKSRWSHKSHHNFGPKEANPIVVVETGTMSKAERWVCVFVFPFVFIWLIYVKLFNVYARGEIGETQLMYKTKTLKWCQKIKKIGNQNTSRVKWKSFVGGEMIWTNFRICWNANDLEYSGRCEVRWLRHASLIRVNLTSQYVGGQKLH